jgi:hypothetical protein
MKSDIFDSFVKIAQEKGMISNDSSDAKKKLEQTHRADSLSASDIEALYGVKPDLPKSMEYEHNIMEDAHPNSVIVAPSYDKLNGLVENNIERQNIILHIVHKQNDGLLTQRKYAEKDLLLTLVRVANDLDNKNKDQLRSLSDACLLQLSSKKNFKKEGQVLVIGLVAAAIGALYAYNHLPNVHEGIEKDYNELMDLLNTFLTSETHWYGTGREYDETLKEEVQGFETQLTKFYEVYKTYYDVLMQMDRPHDAKELVYTSHQPKMTNAVEAYNKLAILATNMLPYMDQMEANFKSSFYKQLHTKDEGILTKVLEKTHLLGGNTSLIADPFQSVINATEAFKADMKELFEVLKEAKSKADNMDVELNSKTQGKNELGIDYDSSTSGPAPTGEPGTHSESPETPEYVKKLNDMFHTYITSQ